MTTRVTLETHDWPVDVVTTDTNSTTRSLHTFTETVEPNSKREFHLTDSRTIQFIELPKPTAAK